MTTICNWITGRYHSVGIVVENPLSVLLQLEYLWDDDDDDDGDPLVYTLYTTWG